MTAIDVHWHVIPPAFVDALRRDGFGDTAHVEVDTTGLERLILHPPEGVTVEQGSPILPSVYDVDLMIGDLDRMKLDLAAVSANPTIFYHWADPTVGARAARAVNDGIAEMANAHPDRIVGLATLPMQDGALAATELERAVLVAGLRGAEICSNINGLDLDHPSLMPVYAAAERLGVPLFVHPQVTGDVSRLKGFHLYNLVGFPFETALAATRLIMGGVFECYPQLKVILAHGGGYFPYQIGRLDHGYSVREEPKQYISRRPSEYLGCLYFDCLTHDDLALRFLVDRVGGDHVVIGTDHPFDMGLWQPVDTVQRLNLSADQEAKLLGRNLAKLLNLA